MAKDGTVILYLWSRECRNSVTLLDRLHRQGIATRDPATIVHTASMDNSKNRRYVMASNQAVKVTHVPCFLVVRDEGEGKDRETTIIDDKRNVEEFVHLLEERARAEGFRIK